VEKRGETNTAWKNRYFVLTGEDAVNDKPKILQYFKDEKSFQTRGQGNNIFIDDDVKVSAGSAIDPDHPHYFEICTQGRTYKLCATTQQDLQEWMIALGGEIAGSEVDESVSSTADAGRARGDSSATMDSFVAGGKLDEVHSGWMKKKGQGPSMFGGKMQKRYFVLYDNRELHYFEGSTMDNITRKGRIRMATATELSRLKPDDKKDFSFIIRVPGRDWVLDPGSMAAWQEWEAKLRSMLE